MSQEEVPSKSVIRRLKAQQSPLTYCQHKPECACQAPSWPIPKEALSIGYKYGSCTCGLGEIRKELE